MAVPTQRQQHYALPSIAIGDQSPPDKLRHHPNAPFQLPSISSAMSIPGARDQDNVPPPLPPPRYILNDPQDTQRRPPPPSNYGSLDDERERPNYQSRIRDDEGYSSLSSFGSSNRSAPKFGLSHDFYRFRGENDYDSSLLKKLDSGRVRENRSPPRRSALTSSFSDMSTRGPPFKTPLSLPMHPSRPTLLEQPLHSASSPRSTPYYSPHDYRSPSDMAEADRSPYRPRRTNSGSIADDMASTHGSDADCTDLTMEETSQMKRLNIEDSFGRSDYRAVGQKRRASSPPGDEPPMLHSTGNASGLLGRREPTSRGSPTPRLSIVPSASRNGPYSASTLASAPSTISAYLSPAGGLSPGGVSPVGPDPSSASPYATPISLNQSPRPPILRNPHQRGISESRPQASPRKPAEQSFSHAIRQQPFFMCDCCPKKPKKFETLEELSAHEAEKQYECSFCGNRFKNKNEAERHQNSLHVRRHSWSCSALSHYDRAFHESTSRPGEADTCGYCGEEFARSGKTGQRVLQATDQDWDDRIRHLQEVHKFRECNSAKKFYRADHFRQHLKHSHAGTSGKWTNMLENACMVEEDPSPR